jgi:OOP family OmpA-OmpF porin
LSYSAQTNHKKKIYLTKPNKEKTMTNTQKKLAAVTIISTMMSGCAGLSESPKTQGYLKCAAAGGAVNGAALALMGAGSAVTGGVATGAMFALTMCPENDTETEQTKTAKQAEVAAVQCEIEPTAGAHTDENGCAYDSDADKVPDGIDRCLNTPEGVAVDHKGCPLNSDADAIEDYRDQCPNTQLGEIVDQNGCAIEQEVVVRFNNIMFDSDSAKLNPAAMAELNEVISKIETLDSKVAIRVEGHADSSGRKAYNQELSKQRANAVASYLIESGVDAERLKVSYFGETKPIANNESTIGRKINRRVNVIY